MRILVGPRVADNAAVPEPPKPTSCRSRNERRHYVCSCCEYKSLRQFNIARHERRIHAARPCARICCDELFYTKGEYYLHVEKVHPERRMKAVTSRQKYKILKNLPHIARIDSADRNTYARLEETVRTRRYSLRLQKKERKESKIEVMFENSTILAGDLEDVPLIYFVKNKNLRKYMKSSCSREVISSSKSCATSYKEELNNNVDKTSRDWQHEVLEDYQHEERQILRIVQTEDRFTSCRDCDICQEDQIAEHPTGQFGVFCESQEPEESSEADALVADLSADSGTSSLTKSRTSSLTGSMTESLTGSLTISQTISQTITQTSSLTCSLDFSGRDVPLKMRMLKECLPLKKRGLQSLESIGGFWQSSTPKRKSHPKKSRLARMYFDEDKENEDPRGIKRITGDECSYKNVRNFPKERACGFDAKDPMSITFENIQDLPVVTQYHRDFLEFIDFDKFKTF